MNIFVEVLKSDLFFYSFLFIGILITLKSSYDVAKSGEPITNGFIVKNINEITFLIYKKVRVLLFK